MLRYRTVPRVRTLQMLAYFGAIMGMACACICITEGILLIRSTNKAFNALTKHLAKSSKLKAQAQSSSSKLKAQRMSHRYYELTALEKGLDIRNTPASAQAPTKIAWIAVRRNPTL